MPLPPLIFGVRQVRCPWITEPLPPLLSQLSTRPLLPPPYCTTKALAFALATTGDAMLISAQYCEQLSRTNRTVPQLGGLWSRSIGADAMDLAPEQVAVPAAWAGAAAAKVSTPTPASPAVLSRMPSVFMTKPFLSARPDAHSGRHTTRTELAPTVIP